MSEIIFLTIGKVEPNPDWQIPGAVHEFHELIFAIHGCMKIMDRNGAEFFLRSGEVAVYPAGCFHAEFSEPGDPFGSIFLCFRAPLAEREITIYVDASKRLFTLAGWLWERRFGEGAADVAWRNAGLQFLLAELQPPPCADTLSEERCRRLRNYLACHLNEPPSLAELAEVVQMSKSYLIHFFHGHFGAAPVDYWNQLRCQEAERLLLYTTLPIKEIAAQLGFADRYHFSKRFKQYRGIPPSQCRAAATGGS